MAPITIGRQQHKWIPNGTSEDEKEEKTVTQTVTATYNGIAVQIVEQKGDSICLLPEEAEQLCDFVMPLLDRLYEELGEHYKFDPSRWKPKATFKSSKINDITASIMVGQDYDPMLKIQYKNTKPLFIRFPRDKQRNLIAQMHSKRGRMW